MRFECATGPVKKKCTGRRVKRDTAVCCSQQNRTPGRETLAGMGIFSLKLHSRVSVEDAPAFQVKMR